MRYAVIGTTRIALASALLMLAHAAGATSLLDAWQAAQQHDPEFAAARSALGAGDSRRDQAGALWRPNVMLSAAAGRMSGDSSMSGAQFSAPGFGQSTGVAFNTSIDNGRMDRYSLSVRQPVLNRERLAQSRQLALSADVAQAEWHNARQALMLRVAERYFEVLVADENLRLLKRQQESVERALVEVRDRFELGDVPVTGTHEAQARADAVRAQVLAADIELQVRQVAFADLTGSAPAQLGAPRAGAGLAQGLAPLEQWLADSARNNPQLLMQEKSVAVAREEAAKHAVSAAPTIDVVAQMGRDRLRGGGDFGSAENSSSNRMIGVQLNVPLYTGGYRSARQQEALHLVDKARSEGVRLRQQIALQTRAAWLGMTAGATRVAALEQALVSTRARLDATRTGNEVGDRTTLDLLNAENDATAAELAVLQARTALALDRLRLFALAGQLNEEQLRIVSEMIR